MMQTYIDQLLADLRDRRDKPPPPLDYRRLPPRTNFAQTICAMLTARPACLSLKGNKRNDGGDSGTMACTLAVRED